MKSTKHLRLLSAGSAKLPRNNEEVELVVFDQVLPTTCFRGELRHCVWSEDNSSVVYQVFTHNKILWSNSHTFEHELQDYQLPEMLRVGLEDLVLQILILDLGQPAYFLGRALNPPTEMSMRNSLKLLEELGAVECEWAQDGDGTLKLEEPKESIVADPLTTSCKDMDVSSELTALGFHLATLPVDPRYEHSS